MAEVPMVQLINGDLYRGFVYNPVARENVEKTDAPRPFAKIDEAMASILKASKGAKELTCTWCGFQSSDTQMREHLKKNHPSVVEPPSDEQIMAAAKLSGAAE